MAELKIKLLPLTSAEAIILMKLIRSSNPAKQEEQDTINIAIKLQRVIDE